jgi:signal transduction histidine kinase
VHTRHSEEELFVHANRAQLATVFVNMLTNAANAIPDGTGHEIELATTASDDRITVSIRDTGVGMSAAVVARIFDPFFTTKPGTSSTGLGLDLSPS